LTGVLEISGSVVVAAARVFGGRLNSAKATGFVEGNKLNGVGRRALVARGI
jgi:hypothetical protein